jgi:putative phosphoesterase
MGALVKVAILADIHGNLMALDAVIADLPSVDEIICCGDIVGYYPDVNQVCSRIQDIGARVIKGNHDAYIIGELQPNNPSPLYRMEWTRKELNENYIEWLCSLHDTIRLKCDGLSILVRHASPWDQETYLYEDSSYLSDVNPVDNEIYIFGHTHYPMIVRKCGGIILNPGSVGQPRDRNPGASYALIDTHDCEIRINRVSYPVEEFQSRLKMLKWEDELIDILSRKGH